MRCKNIFHLLQVKKKSFAGNALRLSRFFSRKMTNGRVFQGVDDPNEVTILFDVADIARAKEFAGSADLKTAMEGAGVVVAPSFHYLEGPAS